MSNLVPTGVVLFATLQGPRPLALDGAPLGATFWSAYDQPDRHGGLGGALSRSVSWLLGR